MIGILINLSKISLLDLREKKNTVSPLIKGVPGQVNKNNQAA